MSRAWRAFFLFSLCFYPAFLSARLSIPEKPEGYITDFAKILSPGARQKLDVMLENFENKTSNQIVVAIFPSLEGESLEDFSIRLAEKWKIGRAGKDNGVILSIFVKDRQMRIEAGYGLEGALPDITAKMIIDNVIAPEFKNGNFDQGVINGAAAIIQATQGEFSQPASAEHAPFRISGPEWLLFFLFAAFLGVFLPFEIINLIVYLGIISAAQSLRNDAWLLMLQLLTIGLAPCAVFFLLRRPVPDSNTISSGGSGGVFSGGTRNSGSSGGWSGGGGGRFGGGGASGRW